MFKYFRYCTNCYRTMSDDFFLTTTLMTKIYNLAEKYVAITLSLLLLSFIAVPAGGQVKIMVKTEADGGVAFTLPANHDTWATATYELQEAIDFANTNGGGEIWVAGGTYLPTTFHNPSEGEAEVTIPPEDDRNRSFIPRNGVVVIGGFSGNETSREERPANLFEGANATILSGDIGVTGDNSDNSYHVVFCPLGTDNSAIFKDLIIANGHANGKDHPEDPDDLNFTKYTKRGGGIQTREGGYFENCHLRNNYAEVMGGGAYLYKGGSLAECEIYNNHTDENGGGVHLNQGGSVKFSRIYGNHAGNGSTGTQGKGGGIFIDAEAGLAGTVSHSIIAGNSADNKGGGAGLLDGGELVNNLITNNVASGNGGGIHFQDGGLVLNNTITRNYADKGAGLHADREGRVINSVIWGNETPYENNLQFSRADETTHLDYCAVENGVEDGTEENGITNLIVLDSENNSAGIHPHFLAPVTFTGLPGTGQLDEVLSADYRVGLESALLNTGTPDVTNLPVSDTDLNGNPRIIKSNIDIGAFETLYYTVTSSVASGTGGTLEPAGSTNLLPGAGHQFTLSPDANHQVGSFTLNGVETKDELSPQGTGFVYTLSGIAEDIDAVAVFDFISALNQPKNPALSIYPNPAGDFVQINGTGITRVEIFSLSGKLEKSLEISELKVPVEISSLSRGIYFVVISHENDKRSVLKLVKK